jgi:hypothetical protein
MVYISNDGEVLCDHLSPKDMLDKMRYLCKGKTEPIAQLYRKFNQETDDGRNMRQVSELLGTSISSIIEVKEESDIDSFLNGGQVSFLSDTIKGLDDFELICFLVVKSAKETASKDDEFRLVVAGSRGFDSYERLSAELDKYLAGRRNVTIISGTARGADRLGERYAQEHGHKIEQVPAQWAKYHQGAGPIRNKQMVKTADAVLVFWDNESTGTRNIIECARAENIPCKIVNT